MGMAVSVSERPLGLSEPRWHEEVGVGVGHIYTQGTVKGARRLNPFPRNHGFRVQFVSLKPCDLGTLYFVVSGQASQQDARRPGRGTNAGSKPWLRATVSVSHHAKV
jgi:hypothetical protein